MTLADWTPRQRPGQTVLMGHATHLEPLVDTTQYSALYDCVGRPEQNDLWRYMPLGPFASADAFEAAIRQCQRTLGWEMMVISAKATPERALGMAGYMRIREPHGSAEVGCVTFSETLQRSYIATEAMYLMARHAFVDLGYRRYEWKCHSQNAASRRAATRLGFQFEGIFRNDMVIKGQNRDTAWFAMIDSDWPAINDRMTGWLDPDNFDDEGRQKRRLEDFDA